MSSEGPHETPDTIPLGSIPSGSNPRPVCFQCRKPEQRGATKYKRCSGCELALYCSKTCQREAWPTHKRVCVGKAPAGGTSAQRSQRIPDPVAARYGFKSTIALCQGVCTWAETHNYALTQICSVTAILEGGIDANLADNRVLLFQLTVGCNNEGDGNPSELFKLGAISICPQDVLDELEYDCRGWDEQRDALARPHARDPRFAGMIRTMFTVVGQNVSTTYHLPVFRLRSGASTATTDEARALLEDVREICAECIDHGAVLGPPDAYYPPWQARTRVLMQRGKRWDLCPLADNGAIFWDTVLGPVLAYRRPLQSGLSPREVFRKYYTVL
ncbi:hypothetical protein BD413DRAFT_28480 [Trametes elegans]|nr:hypothetical protein BD413DRAFT_28480 [Trametes elegans]